MGWDSGDRRAPRTLERGRGMSGGGAPSRHRRSSGCFAPTDVPRPGVAVFARYLPWDSVRVVVSEDSLRQNARILTYKFDAAVRLSAEDYFEGFASRSPHRPPLLFLPGCMGSPGGATSQARERVATPPRVPPRCTSPSCCPTATRRAGPRSCFASCWKGSPRPAFAGHAYVPNATDAPMGTVTAMLDSYGHWALELGVPSLSVQFWLQQ